MNIEERDSFIAESKSQAYVAGGVRQAYSRTGSRHLL